MTRGMSISAQNSAPALVRSPRLAWVGSSLLLTPSGFSSSGRSMSRFISSTRRRHWSRVSTSSSSRYPRTSNRYF